MNILNDCITEFKCWMAQNFLQSNIYKTEVITIGPDTVQVYTSKQLGSLSQNLAYNCKKS